MALNEKKLIKLGKHLSFLLRHQKDNPPLDEHGFANVKDVLFLLGINSEELNFIVENNDKKRFEYSKDKKMIRARQGHTVKVDVDLKETEPPGFLYHGTSTKSIDKIMKDGILKMKRLYVHLISDIEIAKENGSRYGKPCIIVVDTGKMYEDGIKFYKSNNDVWLTDKVEPKYFSEIIYF